MLNPVKSCLAMLSLSLSLLVQAENTVTSAEAEPLRVGLHLSAPWSFYNADGELDGIEYQLLSRIFRRAGLNVEYELHSYSRLLKQFSDKKLDCASPVAVEVAGASYSQDFLPFQDVAVSLQARHVEVDTLAQLADKRIVAYQQAQQVLGPEFSRAISNASYLELAERELQLELLFSDRVDLVIGERRVLQYLAAMLAPQHLLTTHYLFAEKAYPAACWQPALRDVINQGLLQLQQSGEYQHIIQQYNTPPNDDPT
ncbi:transporter substrate-binding domain-containing protein [Rheinheimera sp. FR7-31]|uniref:substrate-binding periplasmic protein n=1 Tax=Rheinheimera fenheensis TaxID=3152295 RepID=UPI00325CE724